MHVLCLNIFGKSVGEASPEFRSVNIEEISRNKDSIQVKGFICKQYKGNSLKLKTVGFEINL